MSFLVSLRPILGFLFTAVATATIVPSIRADMFESATPGSNVTLVASADGNPVPTFKWLKDGIAIPGATSATLVIQSVTTASDGVYNAVASNAYGWALSDDVILSVVAKGIAPFFTVQPYPTSVAPVGSALTLSATAVGTPVPRYQWRKSGSPIAGATNSTLTFNALSVVDGGVYSVVATNSAGSITSNNAIIKVTAAAPTPQIEITPNTPTEPTVIPTTPTEPTVTPTTPTEPTVTPTPPPEPTSTAPVFVLQPQSQNAFIKGSVMFSVAASGTPAPSLQWYKDGVPIAGATATSYTIGAIFASHGGTYTVVATNSAGAVTSSGAVLTVLY